MIIVDVTEDVRDFIRLFRGFELLANNWPQIGEPHVKTVEGRKGLRNYENNLVASE